MPLLNNLLKKQKKTWGTSGIRWSLKIRDKTYVQMIKSKTKQNKTAKLVAYKKYCNKIIDLLKTSRQFDYQIYFKRYKNNSKIL